MAIESELPNSPFQIFPLKDFPHLSEQCIQLLNEEWPRSHASRQNSIRKSMNSEPPLSLILLDGNSALIGHARLCPLPSQQSALWVESIVIWKRLRGLGIGRILMQQIEEWSKERGFMQLFLSTEDKADFYTKCGFSQCQPVVNVGANSQLFQKNGLNKFLNMPNVIITDDLPMNENINKIQKSPILALNSFKKPPPPPPPLIPKNFCNSSNVKSKIYLTKKL